MQPRTLEEYKKLVPEETYEFVCQTLSLLSVKDDIKDIYMKNILNDANIAHLTVKLLYALYKSKYSYILVKNGLTFDGKVYNGSDYDDETFNLWSDFFLTEKDKYLVLTPLRIVANTLDKLYREECDYWLEYIANSEDAITTPDLVKLLSKEADKIEKAMTQKMEVEYFTNMSNDVIAYLQTTARFLNVLRGKDASDNYIKVVSLILALTKYKDVNTDFNAKDIMLLHLNEKNKSSIYKYFVNNIKLIDHSRNSRDLDKLDDIFYTKLSNANMTLLLNYYFPDLKKSNKTIEELLKELYDKYTVEFLQLFEEIEIDDSFFLKVLSLVKQERDNYDPYSLQNKYNNLNINTINYLNNSSRLYTHLLNNSNVHIDNNDAKVLSLFITAFYFKYDNIIIKYFKENNVSLEKIEEYLGIKLNYNDIYKSALNKELVYNLYTDILSSLADSNKDIITINDITNYIMDKERFNSEILSIIFTSITGLKIEKDIIIDANIYFQNKEKIEQENKEKEFFLGLNNRVIDYLTFLSSIYENNYYKKSNLDLYNSLCVLFALEGDITDYLDVPEVRRIYGSFDKANNGLNIDILIDNYKEFVFSGVNKNKKREDITIESIVENAFNPELVDSYSLKKFFKETNVNEKLYKDIVTGRKELYYDRKMNRYDVADFLGDSFKIFKHSNFTDDNKKQNLLYSCLLVCICKDKYKDIIIHNGYNEEDLIKSLGVDKNIISKIEKEEVDKVFVVDNLKDIIMYLPLDGEIKYILQSMISDDNLKVSNRDRFKDEISLEEITYTKEDRLKQLSDLVVEKLDIESKSSIATYGNKLWKESNLVDEEYREVTTSEGSVVLIKDVKDLVQGMYVEEKKEPRSFIRKLFASKEEKKENVSDTLNTIKNNINLAEETLEKELHSYDFLIKYFEVYLEKLNGYYKEVSTVYEEAKEKLEKIDDIDSNYSEYLNRQSDVEITYQKLQTFKQSIELTKQQLLEIHMSIRNHSSKINGLNLSKNTILPVIATQLLMKDGMETEKVSTDITNNMLKLLQNIIDNNIEGAKDNLNVIVTSEVSNSSLAKLESDVNAYININDVDSEKIKLIK